jgi:hypothetical protein
MFVYGGVPDCMFGVNDVVIPPHFAESLTEKLGIGTGKTSATQLQIESIKR